VRGGALYFVLCTSTLSLVALKKVRTGKTLQST